MLNVNYKVTGHIDKEWSNDVAAVVWLIDRLASNPSVRV